ncbi:MAG: FRG domain-containing protein [Staphylococcus equorum]|nr:FRG domain-containing protein [Staphylococcus equorum]MDN6735966.1 FRG domain-containing protein [Tetragenococcus koreensis]MDN6750456.1 FRG domain-containing protein [Staphylococcus equorum]
MKKLEDRFNDWTAENIEKWFGSSKNKRDNVGQFIWYRGVSDSSYKLETSFQRSPFASLDDYYEKIRKCINKLDSDEFLVSDYENFGFAFLQHRGFPSPLLDWTSYVMVAAQFACHNWIDEVPEKDAAIYALNVKALIELFDVRYTATTLVFEDSIYDTTCQGNVKGIPPLKVGPGSIKKLSELNVPTPFQEFEPSYMSPLWWNAMERTIKDPLVARIAPQSGRFTYLPGDKSLVKQIREQCAIKGIKTEDIIRKFPIYAFEREEMKEILTVQNTGGAFGDLISYEKLFPEKKVSKIDAQLETLRSILANSIFLE